MLKSLRTESPSFIDHSFGHIRSFRNISIEGGKSEFIFSNADTYRFYIVLQGKFTWIVENESYTVLPSDLIVLVPGTKINWSDEAFEYGTFLELAISRRYDDPQNMIQWSGLAASEWKIVTGLLEMHQPLIIPDCKAASEIFASLDREFNNKEIGYAYKANHLITDLFITSARMTSKSLKRNIDFGAEFSKLDKLLRDNLAHTWTVGEMAGTTGYGVTTFTEKLRLHCGFSPMNYLINLRISKSISLLKNSDLPITNIALQTGFYSSQHFSTTFKKIVGYSPNIFRKNS